MLLNREEIGSFPFYSNHFHSSSKPELLISALARIFSQSDVLMPAKVLVNGNIKVARDICISQAASHLCVRVPMKYVRLVLLHQKGCNGTGHLSVRVWQEWQHDLGVLSSALIGSPQQSWRIRVVLIAQDVQLAICGGTVASSKERVCMFICLFVKFMSWSLSGDSPHSREKWKGKDDIYMDSVVVEYEFG